MLIGGIDQGTISPAFGLLDLSGQRPRVVHHACLDLSTFGPPKLRKTRKVIAERVEAALDFVGDEMRKAQALGMTHVAIEDTRTAINGLRRAGITNHRATSLQLEQLHRLTERAKGLGLLVVLVEPRFVVSCLGLRLPSASKGVARGSASAWQHKRRAAKKEQTANFVRLVLGASGLSEDENDALAHAFVGAILGRNRSLHEPGRARQALKIS